MRLLLLTERPERVSFFPNVLPPLGVLYLSSACRQHNIDHEVYDHNIGRTYKGDYSEFDVVGLSVNSANVSNSLKLARQIRRKKPDITLVTGGPLAIAYPDFLMGEEFFDIIFIGEAEYSLIDFLKGKTLSQIPGIVYRENGEVKRNEAIFIEDLDAIPFPNFEAVDIRKYRAAMQKNRPVSSLISSRGCPYRCSFCFHNMGYFWRHRSVKNVMDEIEFQYSKLGIKELCIVDDNFTHDIERAEQIAQEIIRRGYKLSIQFNNAVRTEGITREFLETFKKAGLWYFAIAPESANQNTLEKIRKRLNSQHLHKVVQWGRELDLFVYACFMVGFPWEGREDVDNTLKMAVEMNSHMSQISRLTIFPKTELYEEISNFSEVRQPSTSLFFGTQNFDNAYIDSSTLAQMIRKANFRKYFNINALWDIYRHIGIKEMLKLMKFSIVSGNL